MDALLSSDDMKYESAQKRPYRLPNIPWITDTETRRRIIAAGEMRGEPMDIAHVAQVTYESARGVIRRSGGLKKFLKMIGIGLPPVSNEARDEITTDVKRKIAERKASLKRAGRIQKHDGETNTQAQKRRRMIAAVQYREESKRKLAREIAELLRQGAHAEKNLVHRQRIIKERQAIHTIIQSQGADSIPFISIQKIRAATETGNLETALQSMRDVVVIRVEVPPKGETIEQQLLRNRYLGIASALQRDVERAGRSASALGETLRARKVSRIELHMVLPTSDMYAQGKSPSLVTKKTL